MELCKVYLGNMQPIVTGFVLSDFSDDCFRYVMIYVPVTHQLIQRKYAYGVAQVEEHQCSSIQYDNYDDIAKEMEFHEKHITNDIANSLVFGHMIVEDIEYRKYMIDEDYNNLKDYMTPDNNIH